MKIKIKKNSFLEFLICVAICCFFIKMADYRVILFEHYMHRQMWNQLMVFLAAFNVYLFTNWDILTDPNRPKLPLSSPLEKKIKRFLFVFFSIILIYLYN